MYYIYVKNTVLQEGLFSIYTMYILAGMIRFYTGYTKSCTR